MNKFYEFLGLKILPVIIDLYIRSLNIKIINEPDGKENFIYIFWHSKMLTGWYIFRNKNSSALVSQSKDGDILDNLLKKWGYNVVRGSSSKGGKEALDKLTELVKSGSNAVITPDGPRGPVRQLKNGPLIISNKSNVPIIPVSIIYKKKKILGKSWDKFEIPFPFSECIITFGSKYYYSEYKYDNALEDFKSKLSAEL